MKHTVWIIGSVLLAFNTLIGLVVSFYPPFNYLLADGSILLSTLLIYLTSASHLDDGYKIGLGWLFSFTGLVRTLCCMFMPQQTENNFLLVVAGGILLFEIVCMAVPLSLSKNK